MKAFFAALLVLAGHVALCSGLLSATSEKACQTAGGKWLRFWLVDTGDNGMTMDIVNTDTQAVVRMACHLSSRPFLGLVSLVVGECRVSQWAWKRRNHTQVLV